MAEAFAKFLELVPLGDRGFLARFESESASAAWAAAVRAAGWSGITDVVLAYRSVGVHADPERVEFAELESHLGHVEAAIDDARRARYVVIPVLYDGPDLATVADRLGMSAAQVVAEHSRSEYRVFAIGFLPGFPYAGYLPMSLSGLPRRDSPRTRVAAGSVAIAGRQTGIYPADSPGGWHLLGRTPLAIVDLDRGRFPIQAGDRLRFEPISADEFEARRDESLESE